MKTNVGKADRAIRIIVGLALIVLAAIGTIGAWGWLGLVPLATGIARICPLYTVLGIQTCPRESTEPLHFHENLPEHFQNDVKI